MTGTGECETANRETEPMPGAMNGIRLMGGSSKGSPPRAMPKDWSLERAPFVPTISAGRGRFVSAFPCSRRSGPVR